MPDSDRQTRLFHPTEFSFQTASSLKMQQLYKDSEKMGSIVLKSISTDASRPESPQALKLNQPEQVGNMADEPI